MTYKPKLDPKRDLKGATPEKLARALFRRNQPYLPGTRGKTVVSKTETKTGGKDDSKRA